MKLHLSRAGVLALAVMTVGTGMSSAQAALYYLKTGVGGTNWGIADNWNTLADGSGTNATTMTGHDFNLNGKALGTPSGNSTFPGTSLTLSGGTLSLRGSGAGQGSHTLGSAIAVGGTTIFNQDVNGRSLSGTTFANTSGTTTLQSNGGSAVQTTLNYGTLTGAGNFALDTVSGVSTDKSIVLTIGSASGYTGNITWTDADSLTLQFGSGTTFGGGLIAKSTSRITLNQTVTFASVSFDGGVTYLTADNYSFEELNTAYPAIFNDGGSGSITVVPEPASMAGLLLAGLGLMGRRRKC